jgi:ATP-binding cassette subfamily F protein 3
VLSGGERTRLAVARMLLRPSNTLLMDEPTNHLDLDSKDVLLEALADYGGTLIIVSHDRYFVEKLATRIIEIGHGQAVVYPGTYTEYLWHKEHPEERVADRLPPPASRRPERPKSSASQKPAAQSPKPDVSREERKRVDAERRKQQRAREQLETRIAALESRIAEREAQVKALEATMSEPGFYDDRDASRPVIDRHQALMWEVGDLISQWEALQAHAAESVDVASAGGAEP